MANEFVARLGLIARQDSQLSGSVNITGSVIVTGSIRTTTGLTGSLFGTASYVTGALFTSANPALSASYALSASFASNGGVTSVAGTANEVLINGGTTAVGGAVTISLPSTVNLSAGSSLTATSLTGSISSSNLQGAISNAQLQNSSVTVGTTAISLGASSTTLGGLTSVSSTSLTGSITASSLQGAVSNAQLQNSSVTVGSTSISLGATATSVTGLTSLTSTSLTGSLLGTASYVTGALFTSTNPALSASFASTASFVNTLNQNVIITGSLTIGTSSIGSTENTLIVGPSPAGGVGEGGQILLQASGGLYTSASMWDNYQNLTRLLRGTNAGSDAIVASFNMHTKQMSLPAYNGASAFVGTAAANLAVDSSGNVITVSTSGGTVFPYTGTAVITGSLVVSNAAGNSGQITASGAIISLANGAMYFRGGDDAELWDINVANTVGVYGQQDQGIGGIKLGSGGGTLTGRSGSIGIGTINPGATLHVQGNVSASAFSGSLFGTASYVTGALFTSTNPALSASYASNGGVTTVAGTANEVLINGGTAAAEGAITVSLPSTVNLGAASSFTATALTGSITASSLQGAVSNAQLQNSSVTVGSTNIALGATATTITGLTSLTSTSLTGSLLGTASYVTGALFTSTNPALSASYAVTASYASYALNGGSFDVTGSTLYSVNPRSGPNFSTTQSIYIGSGSGFDSLDSAYSVFVGGLSGYSASNAASSSFLGYRAGHTSRAATLSNMIGISAGESITSASLSNFIGYRAGYIANNASSVNMIGNQAGDGAANVASANFIGDTAGLSATDADRSNFLGYRAGYVSAYAKNSNFIGDRAGEGSIYINHTNAIGTLAGSTIGETLATISGSYNNMMGYYAGYRSKKTAYSTIIGYYAGFTPSTDNSIGRNNIIIGTAVSLPYGYENGINLGGLIFGSGSSAGYAFDISSGSANGRVGINQPNPQYSLDVSGSVYASSGYTGSLFGTASWALNVVGGSGVGGSGNTNRIAKFTAGTTIGDSRILDDGTNIQITGSNTLLTGRLGVNSANPTIQLDVLSDDGVAAGEHPTIARFARDNSAGAIYLGYIANGSALTATQIRTSNGLPISIGTSTATQSLTIVDSGNVGIGTISPSYKLHIADATAPIIQLQETSVGDAFLGVDANQFFIRRTIGGADCININSSNNVGIGVSATLGTLHVGGNVYATSFTGSLSGTATSAVAADIVNGTSGQNVSKDDRIIEPNSINFSRMQFGFTSWNNDNASPYADYLHLRSYTDNSGGNDNLLMLRKDALGIRIWQQTFGSATPYASFKDVAWTDGTNATGTWGITSSWATNVVNAPSAFPFTGSARITGSLNVVGDSTITGSLVVSGANGAGIFSQGATIVDLVGGITNTGSYMVWRAPFSCSVVAMYGFREGGGPARVNAVRSGSSGFGFISGSDLSLINNNTWTVFNAPLQNTTFNAGDTLRLIMSGSASNNQLGVQVDFIRKF